MRSDNMYAHLIRSLDVLYVMFSVLVITIVFYRCYGRCYGRNNVACVL